jgi:internalin A
MPQRNKVDQREVERRIEEARLSRAPALDLREVGLTAIPDSLSRLTNLRSLDLSGNQITVILDSLSGLTNLRSLDLSDNQITVIPDSLSSLTNLQSLRLGGNQITSIPDSLTRLTNLQRLHLGGNRVAALPDSLSRLTNLQSLYLFGNQFMDIPDLIASLTNLQSLYFESNQITAVPDSLSRLTNLQLLTLHDNQITAIPDSLTRLTNLQSLILHNNQIAAIPDSLSRLTNLQSLDLSGNPLPDELLAAGARGVDALFRYLESTKRGAHPRTVKLVLLGEPRSGKTTLLNALMGNAKPCDPTRKETIGVNVETVHKDHPRDGNKMHLSVWDFAGQHMEHATHQFSLTKNAVFLILWNARLGAEFGKRDLWYWLELLKMRVGEPKFLLVATHTENTPVDLNLAQIQSLYPGCQGQFPVEFETLAGFARLESKILELAATSPALNAPWPAHWLAVRDEIRTIRHSRPYMTPAEFHRLMASKGVSEEQDQKDLAEQLHQLGEILYFQELRDLASLVILSPAWLTELVALVVRSNQARNNDGVLHNADLDELWKQESLDPEIRAHVCRLMEQFDLTYSTLDARNTSIVVEALPYAHPEDRRNLTLPAQQPRMDMIFRFPTFQRHLPPGIPSWGIARAHRLARPGVGPWRDLALFEDTETGSMAVIQASDTTKEVRLSVAADYPPFFFGRMEAILRDTFRRYPGLVPEERLPCPCAADCRHSYRFEVVKRLGRQGEPYVICDESGEKVSIASLLTGYPAPKTDAGVRALKAEVRRGITMMRRIENDRIDKPCPTVFTLVRSPDFKQLPTFWDSFTKNEELELCLYCEEDSGWHPTAGSLYRFRPNKAWVEKLKKHWTPLIAVTLRLGPLAKAAGWAAEIVLLHAAGEAVDSLHGERHSPLAPLAGELGDQANPHWVDPPTLHVLKDLLEHLDSERRKEDHTAPPCGGLRPHIVEDGRLLWLCPDHRKAYETRMALRAHGKTKRKRSE